MNAPIERDEGSMRWRSMGRARFAAPALLMAIVAGTLALDGCRRTPEQKYARFMERGTACMQRRDPQHAVLEFKSAIQANPHNPEGYYQLALAYEAAGDVRNEVKCLWETLAVNPKHTAAELKLAQVATLSNKREEWAEAEKKVAAIVASLPPDPAALNTLAVAEWRLGDRQEAEKHLNEAFAQFPQNLQSAANLAKVKLANNDLAGAEEVLKKGAASNPKSADSAVLLGEFDVIAGKAVDAEQQFRRALQLNPKHGLAMTSLAALERRAGRMEQAEQLYREAAALPDPQYKPVHAIFLFQSGKRDLAIKEFEKLAQQDSSDRAARSRLVAAYRAANRGSEADKLLAAAIQKNPKDTDALLQRAATYLRAGRNAEAQTDLSSVLHFQPDSAVAHYLLAHAQNPTAPLIRRQELSQALRLNPDFLAARIELAQLLISTKDAKAGLDVLNEAPAAQKGAVPVLIAQNWAQLALGNRAEARKGIDRILATGRPPDALVQDAVFRMGQRDYRGAHQSLDEALKRNPEDLRALDLTVQTFALQKQIPTAMQKVRDYAAQKPNSVPAQLFAGQFLMRNGDLAGARRAFQAVKTADPHSTDADLYLAQLDVAEGQSDSARKRLAGVLAAKPSDTRALLLLGGIEERGGHLVEALDLYRKAVDLDGQNVMALNSLAYLLAEDGKQPDDALKFAQRAQELAPDSPPVADTLGWVLYRKGRYTTAIPYLEQAVSGGPSALRKCHLAMAYFKSGDLKRSREMLAAALKMDPKLQES